MLKSRLGGLAVVLFWAHMGASVGVAAQPFQILVFESNAAQPTVIDSTGRVLGTLPIPLQGSGVLPWRSDDGRFLLYTTGAFQMWHYDFETRAASFLFQENWLYPARWLPASTSQFLFRRIDGKLYRYDLSTGVSSLWQDNDTVSAAYGVNSYTIIDWDEAFSRAVVQVHYGGAGGTGVFLGNLCESDPTHHVCDLTPVAFPGGGSSSWSDVAYSPKISPNGTRVYYVIRRNWTSYRLVEHDLTTGVETTLFSQEGDPPPGIHDLHAGRHLVTSAPSTTRPGFTALSVCDVQAAACTEIYWVPGSYGVSAALTGERFISLSPVASAGDDVTVACTAPLTPVPLDCAASSDPMGGELACTWVGPFGTVTGPNPVVSLATGMHSVGLTVVNDVGLSDSDHLLATVRDTTPPTLELPTSLVVEATSGAGAAVGYSVTAVDACGAASATCTPPSGAAFALGLTPVFCQAVDQAGNSTTGQFSVSVLDTTPPVISTLSPSEVVLWPPSHAMRPVTIAASVADQVDQSVACGIAAVASNEPVEGLGDGDTSPDWVIDGALAVHLRAERSGQADGRVYTISVRCTDDAGNSSLGTTTVTVPKSRDH